MKIGEKIKKLRTDGGINQKILADYLNVDQSLISKIEKGEREVSTDVIKKLSELFGCSISMLIDENRDPASLKVAYRSGKLTPEDMSNIAVINRIALNLEKMNEIIERTK